jgi:hypothetical protein
MSVTNSRSAAETADGVDVLAAGSLEHAPPPSATHRQTATAAGRVLTVVL